MLALERGRFQVLHNAAPSCGLQLCWVGPRSPCLEDPLCSEARAFRLRRFISQAGAKGLSSSSSSSSVAAAVAVAAVKVAVPGAVAVAEAGGVVVYAALEIVLVFERALERVVLAVAVLSLVSTCPGIQPRCFRWFSSCEGFWEGIWGFLECCSASNLLKRSEAPALIVKSIVGLS